MSKHTNPTLIGLFVVGGISLLILAIAVFSSITWFSKSSEAVILFRDSVSGLNIGAPVVFRGVPVGHVSKITLSSNISDNTFVAPVFITLTKTNEDFVMEESATPEHIQERLNVFFSKGLRARLAPQSLLTGQLLIELDFFTIHELVDRIDNLTLYQNTPQIPAIPSRLESIWQRFDALPLTSISTNLLLATKNLANILKTAQDKQLTEELVMALKNFQTMSASITIVMNEAQHTAKNLAITADTLNTTIPNLGQQMQASLLTFGKTMDNTNALVKSLQAQFTPASPTIVNLQRALHEVAEAARSVRTLANTLESQPEMLLRGKIQQP